MLSKVFIALSTLVVLAVAAPNNIQSQCNTSGSSVCCNGSPTAAQIANPNFFGLLGVPIDNNVASTALGCTPVNVAGGGIDCSQKPVCCTHNSQNGLINVQCVSA